jgi:hypothetical protein
MDDNMSALIPCWYIIVAFIWATYQGARGAVEQSIVNAGFAKDDKWTRIFVLYIHDFAFRFVCTLAGFIALRVAYILAVSASTHEIPAALTALMAVSFLVGVIGVGGQLHYVILLGKLPKLPGN